MPSSELFVSSTSVVSPCKLSVEGDEKTGGVVFAFVVTTTTSIVAREVVSAAVGATVTAVVFAVVTGTVDVCLAVGKGVGALVGF